MTIKKESPKARMDKIRRKRMLESKDRLPEYVIPFKEGVYAMKIITAYPMKTTYGDKVVMELQGEVNGVTIKERKFFEGSYGITDQSELGILLNTLGIVDKTNYIRWNRLKEVTVNVTFSKSKSGKFYIKNIVPLVPDEDEAFSEDYEDEDYEEDYEYEDEEDE